MHPHHLGRRPDRLLVLDIETTPDRERLPADHGSRFPKPIYHRIACLSFVEATITIDADGGERYALTSCRSGGEADWDERRILAAFWSFFARRPTRVCGWNSRAFDMPVILQRSMLHGLAAAPWFRAGPRLEGYGYRYSDAWHCDLMDVIADHGACAKLGLDEAAAACGLPGKMVSHGSEVETLVAAGRIAEVRAYCEVDTLNTYGLYLRHALLTGRTSQQGHAEAVASLVSYLDRERGGRPHLGAFQDRWSEATAGHGANDCDPRLPRIVPDPTSGSAQSL